MTPKKGFISSYFVGFNKLTGVSLDEFTQYYDESKYSGYPQTAGGSVSESEGKSIYTLIRALKPKRILEIGNLFGDSSNHILQAVNDNKFGEVVLLDIQESLAYENLLNHNFLRVLEDSGTYLARPHNFDLIVHDSEHGYDHTKKEIGLILANNLAPTYYIWSHDYYSTIINPYIRVQDAYNEFANKFQLFIPFKDSMVEQPCGFLITKKNNTE
jgi:hypothetical protein